MVLLLKTKNQYITIEQWMKYSSVILILVDISGLINFIYVLITGSWLLDDSFSGLYGRSGLSMHTLSLVNFIYCIYYFEKKEYPKFLVFVISGFMCFYGLGLLLFIVSFGLVLLRSIKIEYIKYVISAPILIFLIIVFTNSINPHLFSYMNKNIDRALSSIVNDHPYENEMNDVRNLETVKTPRKILSFKGAFKRIKDPRIFLIGTGPGTYNSRTSFLLNGEYTRNPLFKKIRIRPIYAEKDIYPLWNNDIIFQFNDGTRNQPFSSVMAIFIEYGLLIFTILFFLMFNLFKRTLSNNSDKKLFVRFIFIFLFLNILFENYLEYPEFMILIIIIIKALESNSTTHHNLKSVI